MRVPTDVELPPRVEPMLATAGPVPAGPGWSVEFKWDGMRTLVSVSGERRRVLTRAGREVTGQFPELEVLPGLMDGRQVTLDGELVTLDAAGVPDFARLQRRMLVQHPAAGWRAASARCWWPRTTRPGSCGTSDGSGGLR